MQNPDLFPRDRTKEAVLRALLPNQYADIALFVFPSVDSTNARAREFARNNPGVSGVFLAGEQTAGRGRLGRSFLSRAGRGLYATFLFSAVSLAARGITDPLTETTRAALLAAEVLERFCPQISVRVKWVNDLLVGGKKIAGILTEGIFTPEGSLAAIVLGIGVNLLPGEFPDGLKETAAAVGDFCDHAPDPVPLAAALTSAFFAPITEGWIDAYRSRLAFVGEKILLIPHPCDENAQKVPAVLLGVTDEGHLRVRTDEGECVISTGEISLRLPNRRL